MRNYIKEYIQELEKKLDKKEKFLELDKDMLKEKINYFNHERLIHLIVTVIYVFVTLVFMALACVSYIFLIPFFIGIIFLLFYIPHYFFLENSVQYLYKLYDKIMKKE